MISSRLAHQYYRELLGSKGLPVPKRRVFHRIGLTGQVLWQHPCILQVQLNDRFGKPFAPPVNLWLLLPPVVG